MKLLGFVGYHKTCEQRHIVTTMKVRNIAKKSSLEHHNHKKIHLLLWWKWKSSKTSNIFEVSIYWSEYESRCQFSLRTWIESWIRDLDHHHHLLLLLPRFSQAFFFLLLFSLFSVPEELRPPSPLAILSVLLHEILTKVQLLSVIRSRGNEKTGRGEESLFWGGGSALVERWEWRRWALSRRGRLPLRPRLSLWLHPSILPVNVELRTEPF
jgi:hypothetical protein